MVIYCQIPTTFLVGGRTTLLLNVRMVSNVSQLLVLDPGPFEVQMVYIAG